MVTGKGKKEVVWEAICPCGRSDGRSERGRFPRKKGSQEPQVERGQRAQGESTCGSKTYRLLDEGR